MVALLVRISNPLRPAHADRTVGDGPALGLAAALAVSGRAWIPAAVLYACLRLAAFKIEATLALFDWQKKVMLKQWPENNLILI